MNDSEAESPESCIHPLVSSSIGLNLRFPPPSISASARKAARTTVPEAAIYEDREILVLDEEVGCSWK
jgi:hypothetical protein